MRTYFKMGKIEELRRELARLEKKRDDDREIKRLNKRIKGEKFAQTRGGKIFNAIGDAGLRVGKRLMKPSKKQVRPNNNSQVRKPMNINDVIARLPQ